MAIEHIANRASRHTQECAAGQTTEETNNDQGLDVLRNGTGDHPDHKHGKGNDIDHSSTIEL